MGSISEKFVENAKTVAKMKKIKIADLENQAGITAGYLSKVGKYVDSISLEIATKIARIVDEPMDELINGDFAIEAKRASLRRQIADLETELASLEVET